MLLSLLHSYTQHIVYLLAYFAVESVFLMKTTPMESEEHFTHKGPLLPFMGGDQGLNRVDVSNVKSSSTQENTLEIFYMPQEAVVPLKIQ